MALRQLVYLLVEVENHGNHHDDGDEEDIGAQKLVDDVAVDTSQPGLSAPVFRAGGAPLEGALPRALLGAVLKSVLEAELAHRRAVSKGGVRVYASAFPPWCVSMRQNYRPGFACGLRVLTRGRRRGCGWRQSAWPAVPWP